RVDRPSYADSRYLRRLCGHAFGARIFVANRRMERRRTTNGRYGFRVAREAKASASRRVLEVRPQAPLCQSRPGLSWPSDSGQARVSFWVSRRGSQALRTPGEARVRFPPRPKDEATRQRMQGQARTDTQPELVVRGIVRETGNAYRTHVRDLPGRPDLANKKRRWALFVHGCYWHRHEGCPRATLPKHNRGWWISKFEANVSRDARKEQMIRNAGFRVLVVWECETLDERALSRHLEEWFRECRAEGSLPRQGRTLAPAA